MKKAKKGTKRPAAKTAKSVERKFWPYGIVLFTVLLLIDQWTKHHFLTTYTVGESHQALPGVWFTYVQNTGTIWGILNGGMVNGAFIWLAITAFGLLIFFYDQFKTVMERIAYTLIMVGLWGNLLDRGVNGFVVDFIDLRWWPVFNIADACITVAILILLLEQFRKK